MIECEKARDSKDNQCSIIRDPTLRQREGWATLPRAQEGLVILRSRLVILRSRLVILSAAKNLQYFGARIELEMLRPGTPGLSMTTKRRF